MTAPSSDDLLCDLDGAATSNEKISTVLSSLANLECTVDGIETESELLQPGSHTGVLRVTMANEAKPRRVFLKKVTAKHAPMAQRPWPDRRRTLAYARTEMRFYQEFAADAGARKTGHSQSQPWHHHIARWC